MVERPFGAARLLVVKQPMECKRQPLRGSSGVRELTALSPSDTLRKKVFLINSSLWVECGKKKATEQDDLKGHLIAQKVGHPVSPGYLQTHRRSSPGRGYHGVDKNTPVLELLWRNGVCLTALCPSYGEQWRLRTAQSPSEGQVDTL